MVVWPGPACAAHQVGEIAAHMQSTILHVSVNWPKTRPFGNGVEHTFGEPPCGASSFPLRVGYRVGAGPAEVGNLAPYRFADDRTAGCPPDRAKGRITAPGRGGP